jgi:hypothetical protein
MMAKKLPLPTENIKEQTDLALLAPKMRSAVMDLLKLRADRFADGRADNDQDSLILVAETFRTDRRQKFIYGFGRDYDDGRGIVTKSYDASWSWHGYGLAIDCIHPKLQWDAPLAWWKQLADDYQHVGLYPGLAFKSLPDSPHGQWYANGKCPLSPTAEDRFAQRAHRIEDVWKRYGAV